MEICDLCKSKDVTSTNLKLGIVAANRGQFEQKKLLSMDFNALCDSCIGSLKTEIESIVVKLKNAKSHVEGKASRTVKPSRKAGLMDSIR